MRGGAISGELHGRAATESDMRRLNDTGFAAQDLDAAFEAAAAGAHGGGERTARVAVSNPALTPAPAAIR